MLEASVSGALKQALLGWLVGGVRCSGTTGIRHPTGVGVTLVESHVHQWQDRRDDRRSACQLIHNPFGCEPVRAGQAAKQSCKTLTLVSADCLRQGLVDLAGDVALQHACDLAHGFAFGGAPCDVR